MIGILLNETFELIYTLGNLSINTSKWVYNWYYNTEEDKITQLENKIDMLNKKIKSLEKIN
tara:strand:- start:491 stop:673 length:183 start_codon:yes stop_codon:yes gene_type:complete